MRGRSIPRQLLLVLPVAAIAVLLSVLVAAPASASPAPSNASPQLASLCPYDGGHPTIRRGDTGNAVAHAQCLLHKVWGWGGLAIDGIFGANTEHAVRVSQSNCGLVVDGIVGPNTWAALHPDQYPCKK